MHFLKSAWCGNQKQEFVIHHQLNFLFCVSLLKETPGHNWFQFWIWLAERVARVLWPITKRSCEGPVESRIIKYEDTIVTVKICVCFEKYLVKDIATVLRIQIPSSERLAIRIFVKSYWKPFIMSLVYVTLTNTPNPLESKRRQSSIA